MNISVLKVSKFYFLISDGANMVAMEVFEVWESEATLNVGPEILCGDAPLKIMKL